MRTRYVFPNGEEATMTDAQRATLDRIVDEHRTTIKFETFNTVQVMKDIYGAVLIPAAGMMIGVEKDGHHHT